MSQTKKKTDTRERILHLAEELFAKQGYDGTSTRQIAAGVGISIQTLHHHIKNKANLYNLILESSMAPVTSMINQYVEEMLKQDLNDDTILRAGMDQFVDDLFDVIHENPNYPLLFLRQSLEADPGLKKFELEQLVPIIKNWTMQVEEKVDEKRLMGLDIPLLLLTLSWVYWTLFVNPHFLSGVLEMDMDSPEYTKRLKHHVKDVTVKMLGQRPV
jgi:AcrR family transcriptional regulator